MHTISVDGTEENNLVIRKEQLRSSKEDFYSVYWDRPNKEKGGDNIVTSLGADYTEAGAFVIVASFFAQRLKGDTQRHIEHNAILYASRVLGIPTA